LTKNGKRYEVDLTGQFAPEDPVSKKRKERAEESKKEENAKKRKTRN